MREAILQVTRTLLVNQRSDYLDLDIVAASVGIKKDHLQQYFTSVRAIELALTAEIDPDQL
ncbi:hypothetical protein ACWDKQ_36010 [Saccharopolyspora sp. NPDC000995]